MKKLNKELLVEMINEYLNDDGLDQFSIFPVADFRNFDPADELVTYSQETERIVELIKDFTTSVRNGFKAGDVTLADGEKIKDFQLARIQRALDYLIATIDANTRAGEELDMTTPEV